MYGFVGLVWALFFVAVTGGAGYVWGLVRGRRQGSGKTATPMDDAGAYRAGYLAGHVAGWRDAVSRGTGGGPAPGHTPSPAVAPAGGPWQPRVAVPPVQPSVGSPPPLQPPRTAAAQLAPSSFPGQPLPAWGPPAVQLRPAQAPVPPVRRETPAEAAARKEKRDRQNINITLYIASLLLVAAGALFVGTSLPEMFRFVAMWGITVLFYVTGLVLYPRVARLRPAAMAFTGTGLALVPVTGVAMYNFALHNGPLAWLVTSLLGTAAYVFAAVRLNNTVLAWLSLSFAVSTAWSGVSVLGGALVWYFTALIGLAIVLTLFALVRPRWLPSLYLRPLVVLHPFVVPTVGLAATLTPNFLGKGEYALIMAMCGLYFAVMLFVPAVKYRVEHFFAARAAFSLAIIGAVWDASADASQALFAAILVLGVQSLGMAFGGGRITPGSWWNDAVSCLGLQFIAGLILSFVLGTGTFDLPVYLPFFVVLATAMTLGWKLREAVAFAPGAVLGGSLVLVPLLGAWSVALMFATAAVYWLSLAAVVRGAFGRAFVLSARIAFTVAVPAAVAGFSMGHTERPAFTVLACAIAAGLQQVVGGLFERGGIPALAPRVTTGLFGFAASAALVALSFLDALPGHPIVVAGVLAVLSSGIAAGWLAFPRNFLRKTAGVQGPVRWRLNTAELLAPAAAVVSLVVSAAVVSRGLANLVLAAVLAYAVATALRLPISLHRRIYGWLARAAATVLAGSAYADLLNSGFGLHLAGEDLAVATIVLSVLAAQILLVLFAWGRGRQQGAATADVGLLLAGMAMVTTSFNDWTGLPALGSFGGWQPGAGAILTAAAAAVCSAVLRRRTVAWVFAPAAMVLTLLLRAGHLPDAEILLGIFVAYGCLMVVVNGQELVRGSYLLAVRVLSTALVAVAAVDLSDSSAVAWVAVAAFLFLQIALHAGFRTWLREIPFQRPALWCTLGLQLVIPFGYLLAGDYDGGGRWVVLLALALAGLAAVLVRITLQTPNALYVLMAAATAIVAAAGPTLVFPSTTFLHQAVLDRFQVPIAFMALAAAVTLAKVFLRQRDPGAGTAVRWMWFTAAMVFAGAACLFSLEATSGLTGAAMLTISLVFFVGSHVGSAPSFYAGAAPSALVGAVTAVDGVLFTGAGGPWRDFLPWLVGGVGAGLAMYGLARLGGAAVVGQPWRRNALAATALAAFAAAAAVGLGHDATALVGAFLVVMAGAVVVAEVPAGKHAAAEMCAVVAVGAFQRAVLFTDGAQPDWFWLAQWYVVAGVVVAGVRYLRGHRDEANLRLGTTSGILSLSSVATIFFGTPTQQVYVLAAHAVLLGVGLLLSERLFTAWGAAGVAASVMWALRSYAFALLALVALALIVLAVWRLNRRPQTPERGLSSGSGRSGNGVG
ncbi:hypothetical protein [Paenarthrobacter sp. NPDC058040]|uniref:hypothetical protein n=1 Tax=unclassified Paenarthrobacter TaxID=2634190 RepID=UPI0036DEBB14